MPAADLLGETVAELAVTDLPGFAPPAVAGHAGRIRSVRAGDRRLLVLLGRTHLYEGRGVAPVVHGVRTAAAAGCRVVVLTNGCGGLRPGLVARHPGAHQRPHQPHRPLAARRAPPSSTSPTSTRRGCATLCREVDPTLAEGVYAQFPGPHYETPAEIRMVRAIGGDLVGHVDRARGDRRARGRAWRSSASRSSPTSPRA